VKADWLVSCIDQKRFVPWKPSDMWFARKETEDKFKELYDEFGDSYTEPVTELELKNILAGVKSRKKLDHCEIAELESKYFPNYKYGLFRQFRFYVDYCAAVDDSDSRIRNSPLDLIALTARLYGGCLVDKVQGCTHVIVNSNDLSRVDHFVELNREQTRKMFIVTDEWIKDCVEWERIRNEKDYFPMRSVHV